ncbi:Tetratricopeptide repeat protein 4 [Folsomia candida]|uniref:Tetratricopeptide repeat protein 4 n=1 Tax=Folsomia candida TaxID=158441 RepID=A0A226DM54_FOLCA|nr:Tetratricopeptide repeat protein 4 [Folsomia candida]
MVFLEKFRKCCSEKYTRFDTIPPTDDNERRLPPGSDFHLESLSSNDMTAWCKDLEESEHIDVHNGQLCKPYFQQSLDQPPQVSSSIFLLPPGISKFLPHLHALLDVEPPNWDKNHEYGSADVDVYYVDGQRGGWVKTEEGTALRDVMRQERYYLPSRESRRMEYLDFLFSQKNQNFKVENGQTINEILELFTSDRLLSLDFRRLRLLLTGEVDGGSMFLQVGLKIG